MDKLIGKLEELLGQHILFFHLISFSKLMLRLTMRLPVMIFMIFWAVIRVIKVRKKV